MPPRLVYNLDAIENLPKIAFRNLTVMVVLQIEPKLCGRAKCLRKPKCRIGRDASLLADDPLDPGTRQTANFSKSARRPL
jgi:hypothetical protein